MKAIKRTFLLIFLMAIRMAHSQVIIEEKIERKISLSPYMGVIVFPANVSFNDLGLSKNVFAGYSPAPVIGMAALYKYRRKVFFGADANFFFTSRDINNMNGVSITALAKLNIINPKRRISPYLMAGMNISFLNLIRSKSIREFAPEDSTVLGDGLNTTKIEYRYNELNLYMVPVYGPVAGAGIDVKINRKFTAFVQASIQTSFGTSPLIKSNYPENNSVLQYGTLRGGVNMKLFKNMNFKMDTSAVYIPDAIVMLTPNELETEEQKLLNREAQFSINLREGLRHNIQMSINDSEINITMEENGPCKTSAILYDQFGNKIAEAVPGPDGKVNFSNLGKGVYNVAFEVQPPCQESNFSYKINDPADRILTQANENYAAKNDSLSYNIEGFVDFKDGDVKKEGVQILLIDETTKIVKSKRPASSSGAFSFRNIQPGNYKVVYQVPSLNRESRIAYNVKDNHDKLIKQESLAFNDSGKKPKEGTRLMQGKLEMNDTSIALKRVNLDLIDKYNRVIQQSVANEDGTYELIDRKSDNNEIIFDFEDKIKEKLLANAIPSPLVRSVEYKTKVNANEGINNQINSGNLPDVSHDQNYISNVSELDIYKFYDIHGAVSTVSGFGFQVGAFRNLNNVYHLMDKLKSEGFEVYVQMIMSNDISSKFKTSQVYKVNRIIVFGGENDEKANSIKNKLVNEGYSIVVKEHFRPQNQYRPDKD